MKLIFREMAHLKIPQKYSTKSAKTTICISTVESPLGKIVAAADNEYVYIISFEDSKNFEKMFQTLSKNISCDFMEQKNEVLKQLESEFSDYFSGKLKKFTVPLKTIGSEFQKEVWKKLQELPYASTQTYGELAKAMGRDASHARAIGAACGANAHLLVIPCHRLVASGSKGGFSCGVDRKEWLLKHEKKFAT